MAQQNTFQSGPPPQTPENIDSSASSGTEDSPNRKMLKKAQLSATGNLKITREITIREGTTAISYTDDLLTLAIGLENGAVQLYQKGTPGHKMYDLEMMLEAEPCTDIKIKSSPKGGYHKTVLATYLSGHIKLWDTVLGKCLFTMKENRQLYGVSYHPRTNRFATVGNDFKVNLYDEELRVTERILAASEIFGSTNGHTNSSCCVRFHPKNCFELISAGMDDTIQFWDMRAAHAIRSINGVHAFGDALDISDDGTQILTCLSPNANCIVRLYDYGTGKMIKDVQLGATYYPYTVKFLTPNYVGVGCFYQHAFRVASLRSRQVIGSVINVPGPVMSFTIHRKYPKHKLLLTEIPNLVITSGEKVLELEASEVEDYDVEDEVEIAEEEFDGEV